MLAPLDGPTHLAACTPHSSDDESHGEFSLTLDTQRTARLTEFAKHQHVTLNTLIQSAWLLLLQCYTHAHTVTFGATVAGRPEALEGIERMVGLFINTIPVVVSPKPSMSVAQWLETIQQQAIESREYEHIALYDIQRWLASKAGSPCSTAFWYSRTIRSTIPCVHRLNTACRFRISRRVNKRAIR
ncbi:Non-ribosomal peptide synthetase module [Candidatus Burkholderia humilis]|nr:Non-ribosomal peptide synthetase module [Candidatus Burkholderia humilis]